MAAGLVQILPTTVKERFVRYLAKSPLPYVGVNIFPTLCLIEWAYGYWWLTFLWTFFLLPTLDLLFGDDWFNLTPEEEEEAIKPKHRTTYRWFLFLHPALHFAAIVQALCVVQVRSGTMTWFHLLGAVVSVGITDASSSASSHELMHKREHIEVLAGFLGLSLYGNGHFVIDHVETHHTHVGTAKDPDTAKYGENVYKFILRNIPGVAAAAWEAETSRLAKMGLGPFTFQNRMVWTSAVPAAIFGASYFLLGGKAAAFYAASSVVGCAVTGMVNYVQHYGLVRVTLPDGQVEKVHMYHSWDAPELISNFFDVKLQRHTDHHLFPLRQYQTLRMFEDTPNLPTGLFGCLVMSAFPPVWFAVMHPRVKEVNEKARVFREYRSEVKRRTNRVTSRYGDAASVEYETLRSQ